MGGYLAVLLFDFHADGLAAQIFRCYQGCAGTNEGIDDPTNRETREIVEIGDELLTDRQVPIIVVTIGSMGQYGADRYTIEQYARALFDEWGVGFEEWNFGMLLLVSQGDRRARIELGASWAA